MSLLAAVLWMFAALLGVAILDRLLCSTGAGFVDLVVLAAVAMYLSFRVARTSKVVPERIASESQSAGTRRANTILLVLSRVCLIAVAGACPFLWAIVLSAMVHDASRRELFLATAPVMGGGLCLLHEITTRHRRSSVMFSALLLAIAAGAFELSREVLEIDDLPRRFSIWFPWALILAAIVARRLVFGRRADHSSPLSGPS